MSNYPNIALAGPAGVGKTTIANMLEDRFGYTRLSFATPIKAMLRMAYGTDHKDAKVVVFDRDNLAAKKTIGQLAQILGTDAVRNTVDQAFWLRCMEQAMANTLPPWVIDDLRFDNEAKWAAATGFYVVRLERPDARTWDGRSTSHESEVEARKVRAHIVVPNVTTPLETTDELMRVLAIEVTKSA